jgi:ligand-binding SRPBCC domain-containing protein
MQAMSGIEMGFSKNGNFMAHGKGDKSKTNRPQKGFVSMAKILRFTIVTPMNIPTDKVWNGFNRELLASLKPPFSRLEFLQYEGQQKGDSIRLRVHFLGEWISQTWHTQIIAHRGTCFIDCSLEAPAPLSFWHHVHAVLPGPGKGCRIVDRISFACPNNALGYLLYLPLYFLFSMRRSGYRRYFGKLV